MGDLEDTQPFLAIEAPAITETPAEIPAETPAETPVTTALPRLIDEEFPPLNREIQQQVAAKPNRQSARLRSHPYKYRDFVLSE